MLNLFPVLLCPVSEVNSHPSYGNGSTEGKSDYKHAGSKGGAGPKYGALLHNLYGKISRTSMNAVVNTELETEVPPPPPPSSIVEISQPRKPPPSPSKIGGASRLSGSGEINHAVDDAVGIALPIEASEISYTPVNSEEHLNSETRTIVVSGVAEKTSGVGADPHAGNIVQYLLDVANDAELYESDKLSDSAEQDVDKLWAFSESDDLLIGSIHKLALTTDKTVSSPLEVPGGISRENSREITSMNVLRRDLSRLTDFLYNSDVASAFFKLTSAHGTLYGDISNLGVQEKLKCEQGSLKLAEYEKNRMFLINHCALAEDWLSNFVDTKREIEVSENSDIA